MVHLPAVNTPQFDWCHTTMDRHPQPVPPIYQPEVPAKYIVEVALDGRRSRIVGSWNKMLVAAGQVAPGFGNQYAALGAWDSQLTDQPIVEIVRTTFVALPTKHATPGARESLVTKLMDSSTRAS